MREAWLLTTSLKGDGNVLNHS